MLEVLLQASQKMKWTPHARVVLEMAVVELCHPEGAEQAASGETRPGPAPSSEGLGERIRLLERRIKELEKAVQSVSASAGAAKPERSAALSEGQGAGGEKLLRDIDPMRTEEVRRHWPEVLARVKEQKITVHAWLIDGEPVATEEAVIVALKTRSTGRRRKGTHKTLIEKVMAEVLAPPADHHDAERVAGDRRWLDRRRGRN